MTDLHALGWPRRTERLVIRPFGAGAGGDAGDADAMWHVRAAAQVSQWLPTLPADRDQVATNMADPARRAATLLMEHEGVVIGDLMVRVEDAWAQSEVKERAAGAQAELGWTIDPAYAGRGLATEAVRDLLAICFDGLGLHRVIALCFADNEPSWRLMERVGMRREQHLVRDSLHRELGWCDTLGYAILADEWRDGS